MYGALHMELHGNGLFCVNRIFRVSDLQYCM